MQTEDSKIAPIGTQTGNSRAPLSWWTAAIIVAVILLLAAFSCDSAAQTWIAQHQSAPWKKFMRAVSHYGDWPAHVALGAVLATGAYLRGSKQWTRIFLATLIACAFAGAAARVLKVATGRTRPSVATEAGWNSLRFSSKSNAFPSGHTAASTAFFGTLTLAAWRVGLPLMVIPLLIGFSRMYVAAHYLSDVVGAVVLGIVSAVLVWQFIQTRLSGRERPRHPPHNCK